MERFLVKDYLYKRVSPNKDACSTMKPLSSQRNTERAEADAYFLQTCAAFPLLHAGLRLATIRFTGEKEDVIKHMGSCTNLGVSP